MEYVEEVDTSPAVQLDKPQISALTSSSAFNTYLTSHPDAASIMTFAVRNKIANEELSPLKRSIETLITNLGNFLAQIDELRKAAETENDFDALKSLINNYPRSTLLVYTIPPDSVSSIKSTFLPQLQKEYDSNKTLLDIGKTFSAYLDTVKAEEPTSRFKCSILNRGNTDGLVKSVGMIQFRGLTTLSLMRIDPPAKDNEATMALAVPVMVTNPQETIRVGSVGKIANHSMAEFWFVVDTTNLSSEQVEFVRNMPREDLRIALFDQENNQISYSIKRQPRTPTQ